MGKNYSLSFNANAKISTNVDDVKKIVNLLNSELKDLQLPTKVTKDFEGNIRRLVEEIRTFEKLTSGKAENMGDVRAAENSWGKIVTYLNKIGVQIDGLGDISDKIFTKKAIEGITKANEALDEYQKKLQDVRKSQKYVDKQIERDSKAEEEGRSKSAAKSKRDQAEKKRIEAEGLRAAWQKDKADSYQKQLDKQQELQDKIDEKQAQLDEKQADRGRLKQQKVINESRKEVSQSHQDRISGLEEEISKLNNEIEEYDKAVAAEEKAKKSLSGKKGRVTSLKNKGAAADEIEKAQKAQEEAEQALQAATEARQALEATANKNKKQVQEKTSELDELKAQAEEAKEILQIEKDKAALEKELEDKKKNKDFKNDTTEKDRVERAERDAQSLKAQAEAQEEIYDKAKEAVERLNQELRQMEIDDTEDEWKKLAEVIKDITGEDLSAFSGDIEKVRNAINDFEAGEIKSIPDFVKRLKESFDGADKPIEEVNQGLNDTKETIKELDRAQQELESFKGRILDFFSISNTIQIFKDALRDAFDTVKELDAAMTETAVVTDFSIGDMWEKLPEYSKRANELGTSIKSLYDATTLYYQQGLNSDEAMGVGIETMKMARIANMEASDATQAMTAALRGFGMEINQISATRVNDVYSELAAITASDTQQIATAMTKTASIAASANMEFETTAAFLAQIIETTQEAPETAGTAMKTIIARFTEVKKMFSEGMLSGEDEEGEAININKIDEALKSVGISLKDFLTGSKGIDDIFLELASKWDTLDLATQRYIATTAAGSRQQSRFIAMMSDYERTMELVTAANGSAGASQKQFDKTLDSMEAKLQRLKNAWDTFVMGLANNEVIKAGVDLLTGFLETLNNMTDNLDSASNSITKLVMTLITLNTGKNAFNAIFSTKQYQGKYEEPKELSAFVQSIQGFGQKVGVEFNQNVEQSYKTISKWSAGVNVAGLAFMGLGEYLDSFGGRAEKVGQALSTLGQALIVVSGAIQLVNASAKMLGTGFTGMLTMIGSALPWIAGIAAVGGILYTIGKVLYDISPEGKLKKAKEATKQAEEAAAKAAEEYDNLARSLDSIEGKEQSLENLTKGTDEWRQSVKDLNNEILTLIENYPELKPFLTTEGGQLAIDRNKTVTDGQGTYTAEDVLEKKATQERVTAQQALQNKISEQQQAIDSSYNRLEKFIGEPQRVEGEIVYNAPYVPEGYEKVKSQKTRLFQRYGDLGLTEDPHWYYNNYGKVNVKDLPIFPGEMFPGQFMLKKYEADSGEIITWDWSNETGQVFGINRKTSDGQVERLFDSEGNPTPAWVDVLSYVDALMDKTSQKLYDIRKIPEGTPVDVINDLVDLVTENGYVSNEQIDAAFKNRQYKVPQYGDEDGDKINDYYDELRSEIKPYADAKISGRAIIDAAVTEYLNDYIAENNKESVLGNDLLGQLFLSFLNDDPLGEYKDVWKEYEEYDLANGYSNEFLSILDGYYKFAGVDNPGGLTGRQLLEGGYGIDEDLLYNYLKSMNGIDIINDLINQVADKKNEMSPDNQKLFSEIFGGEGLSLESFLKHGSFDATTGKYIAKDPESIENLIDPTYWNMMPEYFQRAIDNAFARAGADLIDSKKGIVGKMVEFSANKNYADHAFGLLALEQRYQDLNIPAIFENVFNKLANVNDLNLQQAGFQAIYKTLLEANNLEDVQTTLDFFNSLDFSNPITALAAINQQIQIGTGSTKELAHTLKDSGKSFFGLSSQLSALFKTKDYTEIEQKLSEIVEKNKQITATDVKELAKEYGSLNKILENNEMTASGLARVLEEININGLDKDKLTDPILAAISTMESLQAIAEETVIGLNEFDLGIDESTVGETAVEWGGIIAGNLEKGAIGNSQNFRILDYLFPGWETQLEGDDMFAKIEYLSKKLQGNGQNLREMWSDIAQEKDIFGQDRSFENEVYENMGLTVDDTGEKILFGGWKGKGYTSEDLVGWISDAYNVSKEMAGMLLTDFKNNSADLAKELRENDYAAGIKKAYDRLHEEGGVKIIDEQQIETLSRLLGFPTEKIIDDLKQLGEIELIDLFEENGQLVGYEEINKEMEEFGERTGISWKESFVDEVGGKLNLTQLEKQLGKIGITGENAENIKQQAFEAIRKGISEGTADITEITAEGFEITVPIDKNATYEQYKHLVAEAAGAKKSEQLAEAFATALGDFKISLNPDTADTKQFQAWLDSFTSKVTVSMDSTSSTLQGDILSITDHPYNITVKANVVGLNIPKTVGITAVVSTVVGAAGAAGLLGGLPGHAKGIKNAPHAEDALVSEEGPELIQKANGGAYLTGLNGPELAHIERGDTVYTAEETKQILKKRSHSVVPRFAEGYGGGTAYHGASGGKGGGGNGKTDNWENPFDKLYNLIREIDEELRQRERLERRYEKLLESIDLTAGKLFNNAVDQLKQLERERLLNEEMREGRRWQIEQYQKENEDLLKYAKIVQNERGEDVLRINWDAIDAVSNQEEGKKIEDYVNQLEEWMDGLNDIEDALNDIEDRVEEIMEIGKEELLDLEESVKEALIDSYQKQIDNLSDINESINNTNAELLDAMRNSIEKMRQERENQETEDEIAEKQRRLAYLQQDTSGANALEILNLQKEIDEETTDYTDSLIDQKLDELEQQNQFAEKQREQQITILQEQLDHAVEVGAIWEEIQAILDDGMDEEVGLVRASRLEELLKDSDGFQGMSKLAQMEWLKELQQQVSEAVLYLRLQNEDVDTSVNINRENYFKDDEATSGSGGDGSGGGSSNASTNKSPATEQKIAHYQINAGDTVIGTYPTLSEAQAYVANLKATKNAELNSARAKYNQAKAIYDKLSDTSPMKAKYGQDVNTYKKQIDEATAYLSNLARVSYIPMYKTGGLADFTGPAWLDGTKARPELVLNARDTQNFIQLKDILASLLNGSISNTSTENNGGITYDIDINVESIGSDYDVEQVANKVKSMINDNARYRNNNAVSLKR